MLQETGSKSHECKVEYSETKVSTVKLTYTDDQGTSYTTTGRLDTTVGKENFTWGGITVGSEEEKIVASEDENTVEALAKAGRIKRWDKINYNPGTKTTASISLPSGATIDGTINASSATDWVVLDVNETTGEVLIMPKTVSNPELALIGKEGYNNSLKVLQAVADIYLNTEQASSVRSLTVDDINKVEGHIPNGTVAEYTWNHRYGMDSNLNITDTGSDSNTPSQTYTSTAATGESDSYSTPLFVLTNKQCWLASRVVGLVPNRCSFCVQYLSVWGFRGAISCFSIKKDGSSFRRNRRKRGIPCGYAKTCYPIREYINLLHGDGDSDCNGC